MTRSNLTHFFDEAYNLLRGQFYPERHLQNLKLLGEQFSEFPAAIVDALYRFSIHLDTSVITYVKDIQDGKTSRKEAIKILKVTYQYFSDSTIETAIDWNSD